MVLRGKGITAASIQHFNIWPLNHGEQNLYENMIFKTEQV